MKHVISFLAIIAFASFGFADTINDENLPSRPIGQTVAGTVLCGISIPLILIGLASMSVSPQDPEYISGNYGLGKYLGVVGCAFAGSGIVLLARANYKWQIYNKAVKDQNGKLSFSTGLLLTHDF
jgi:hypothetical protein